MQSRLDPHATWQEGSDKLYVKSNDRMIDLEKYKIQVKTYITGISDAIAAGPACHVAADLLNRARHAEMGLALGCLIRKVLTEAPPEPQQQLHMRARRPARKSNRRAESTRVGADADAAAARSQPSQRRAHAAGRPARSRVTEAKRQEELGKAGAGRPGRTWRKCEAPWVSAVSSRLPVAEKMAIEHPSDDLDSVTTVMPLGMVVTSILGAARSRSIVIACARTRATMPQAHAHACELQPPLAMSGREQGRRVAWPRELLVVCLMATGTARCLPHN
jgi:hypothetical protein